jgi:hypothetical protein
MATQNEAYLALSELNLWYKVESGDDLKLVDVPQILPLRWVFFKTNWEFLKPNLIQSISYYENPDFLNQQIKDFSLFIESQRYSKSKLNPFNESLVLNRYYAIFDNIKIVDTPLTNEEQRLVDIAINKVRAFSKNDFIKIKKTIIDHRDRYADTVSLSDLDYNRTFHKSSISSQISATITDANYMLQLQNGITTVDFILANYFANDVALDPFALARQNANNPDINIGQYASGKLVRLEVGQSLQSLAYKYLGNQDKWLDIAIANGLKPPYIDEIGERLPLLSNGSGNLINLSGTDISGNLNIDKLYINQVIYIQSDTQVAQDQRKIINIRQIPISNEIIVELDGAFNLSNYHIADNAHIRVYKPNTVNSGFYVLIPSSDPLPNSRRDEIPWFLANAAEDEKQTKIDLAVNSTGDLILSPNGDLKLSYGLDNAIQAIKFKLSTEVGSLILHPGYGMVNILGQTNRDIGAVRQQISDSISSQIAADARFDRVDSIDIEYNNKDASLISVTLVVRLAGGNQVIPISFTVNV